MRECGTYELHRSLFLGYYEDGICKREEGVLLNEVEYEQRRMTEAIVAMLKKLTEYRPIMIVINRFQLAGRSSMELIYRLLTEPCTEIGIVLGVNEMQPRLDMAVNMWDAIVEKLEDSSQIYHIGSSGKHRNRENAEDVAEEKNYSHMLAKVETIITFLDCDQAKWYLQRLDLWMIFPCGNFIYCIAVPLFCVQSFLWHWRWLIEHCVCHPFGKICFTAVNVPF